MHVIYTYTRIITCHSVFILVFVSETGDKFTNLLVQFLASTIKYHLHTFQMFVRLVVTRFSQFGEWHLISSAGEPKHC